MDIVGAKVGRTDAKIIGLVCFPHMMSHVYWLVIPPMFPALMAAFDLTALEAGVIVSVFAAATMVAQTPVGFLIDRVGARWILIGGLAIEGAAIAMFGVAGAYWHLLVLAGIAGLGHTVFHPADYAILSARVSERRMGRAFSIHSATGYAGFAIAPIYMTEVAARWSWQAAFLSIGVIGLFASLVLLLQSGSLRDEGEAAKEHRKKKDAAVAASEKPAGGLSSDLRLLLSIPVLMCFLYFILHQLGGGGLRAFLVVALADLYDTPIVDAARALSAFTIGSVVGILTGGVVADRFGPRIMTGFATLVPAGLIIGLLGWIDIQGVLLVVLLAVSGYLIGVLIPSRDLLLRSVTPPGSMGKVMGFASTGTNLGGAIIPAVLGYVMDVAGGTWVFGISAIFIGAAFLTFITASRKSGH